MQYSGAHSSQGGAGLMAHVAGQGLWLMKQGGAGRVAPMAGQAHSSELLRHSGSRVPLAQRVWVSCDFACWASSM